MTLKEVILNCNQYEDSDEFMHMVFAKKLNDSFESLSEAKVLRLSMDEMEMKLTDIQNSNCPGFDYFLEMYIIQDIYTDMRNLEDHMSDDEKVKRIIHYAEFDA